MDNFQTLLSNTSGRDKVAKLIQYTAKLISWHLKLKEVDVSSRLAKWSTVTADARRLGRFFNELTPLKFILSFNQASLSADPVIYTLDYLGCIFNANYLIWDHVRWFRLHSVIDGDLERYKYISSISWFYLNICLFLANTIKLLTVMTSDKIKGSEKTKQQTKLTLNYIKIIPDIIISAAAGKVTTAFDNDGLLSSCGVIGGLYGLYESWPSK